MRQVACPAQLQRNGRLTAVGPVGAHRAQAARESGCTEAMDWKPAAVTAAWEWARGVTARPIDESTSRTSGHSRRENKVPRHDRMKRSVRCSVAAISVAQRRWWREGAEPIADRRGSHRSPRLARTRSPGARGRAGTPHSSYRSAIPGRCFASWFLRSATSRIRARR